MNNEISYILLSESEVIRLRNILANVYMDTLGHNDLIATEAKHGLDLTIKILEEYHDRNKE